MERERLTITLRKSILAKIDQAIDGARIRNRSHAIEYLLSTCFPNQVRQGLILAGGPGVKMRPFTYEMPKAMIPVAGRPILEQIIELLRSHDIRDLAVVIGPLGDKIRNHFGDGGKFGVKIDYVDEPRLTGTAGSIRRLEKKIDPGPMVVIYGDVLADINLRDMIEFHKSQSQTIATMALTPRTVPGDWGVAGLRGNLVVSFAEKPQKPAQYHLINAGIFVVEPKIIDYFPDKIRVEMEKDLIPKLIKDKALAGYVFEGKWFDIATPETYEAALKAWK